MSDILCRWLNQELQLSKAVPKTIAKDFASGYLMGEVLHKYQLQNDFNMFMKKTSVSKLNNFTRLEPTLQLLGISFDINTAQDLIQEKQGAATRLLYQLYVSLEKNRKAEISGTMMEIMQPAGCASLHKKEHQIYSDRLRQVVKRDTELKLQKISQHYEEKFQQFVVTPPIEQKRQVKVQDEKRLKNIDKSNRYIQEIRKRLEENAIACKEREKRQDRFLVEQLKVHEAQEEARREEQLVKRLTRQTQQEQRLATQLLQIRMQKEVIRENRLFREQQYQQRRERDFQEALDREAALAQQAKLDRAEEIKKELEFCNRIAVERTQRKYKKHFENCRGILEQIMDLATKVGEYRLLNGSRIPEKLMREWKELLFSGLPLYEPVKDRQPGFGFREPLDTIELQKQEILNNQDYDEYTNMMGEWGWPEEAVEVKLPVTNNDILGYIVQRLRNVVDPPITEPSSSLFPHFILKACVLGKFCSGKTTCLSKIAEHGIYVLSTDTLIEEALNAHKNGEKLSKRAIQGAAVEKELRKGNTIPNELLVDIIVEAIWILDGFPFDIAQAHLLEKALGGDVSLEKEVVNSSKNLAKDPNPPKPPPPPAPVLDLVLLLDIPDEITAFQDTWPKLEKWFGKKQNILFRVDADVDVQELYSRVESILHQAMLKGVKTVMQELRLQRSVINHHLFNIEHYKHYLGRPDLKQELVSQWQKNFNSIPDDMKEDEDTKEELHLRLDELRERLWDITDKRKEQDEQERASLMSDGWLEEHIVVLVNHHSILTQKAHGLVMVQSLQSTVEEIFGNMEKWLHERYLAEMKQECSDFYLNGDCRVVASPLPPPRPPPLEKPMRSTPTIAQLELLYQQLYSISPSTNMGKDTLPEPWMDKSESQLMEIVSSLTDSYELVDWRRFLLSAALPWPFPLLSQLLDVLQQFKAADTGDTTELWFSTESVQTVPVDPSEPVPYVRLANLRKQNLVEVFRELGYDPEDHVPFSILSQHPSVLSLMESCTHHQLV
uniref:Sperm flagellar 2 n=1 Tax=Haplochromis burtoni TaxID=8153 RepID=A0A3Q2V1T2_HAPBU